MSDVSSASPPAKDRSTGLTVIGCFQIVLGLLCALFVPLALLQFTPAVRHAVEMSQGRPPDTRAIVFSIAFYVALATFFIWTGIGAMRKRRWVRPVLLSVAWPWFLSGVVATLLVVTIMPRVIHAILEKSPRLPSSAGTIIAVMMAVILVVFYLVFPLTFILFYRSPHVRATLEARDPIPGWTEACPVPVFGLSLWLLFTALAMLFIAWHTVFPVFSILLTGPLAVVLACALSALYIYLAWAAYRLHPIGWWGPLILSGIQTTSGVVYFLVGDINAYLAAAGTPPEQARILADSGLFGTPIVIGIVIAFAVLAGYLVWVRKYFVPPAAQALP